MNSTSATRINFLAFGRVAALITFSLISMPADGASSGTVITIAGDGSRGFSGDGGPATNAAITEVEAMVVGPDGTIYFADNGNYRIRAIDPSTGQIRTVAGNGTADNTGNGGLATNASISLITSLATDRSRNVLYLSDINRNLVRRINLTDGIISIYAGTGTIGFTGDGGAATLARLRRPWGLATDAAGKLSLAAQYRVRQVNPITGIINTIAGGESSDFSPDGFQALSTSFHGITELAADPAGNVFVFEGFSSEPRFVRRIDVVSGLVSTVAGGGTNAPGAGVATNMQFIEMFDIAVSAAGELFIAMNFQLFRVDLATGLIAPIAGDGIQGYGGDGGPALAAQFSGMSALAVIPGGGIVVADSQNYRIRYVAPNSIQLTNDSGQTSFTLPWVNELDGDLILENNSNLTNINVSAVTNVGGVVSIGGNTAAGEVNLDSLQSAGTVEINGNTAAGVISLSELGTVAGEVNLTENTSASVIDLGSLQSAGTVEISGNTAAGVISLGELETVAGEVTVTENPSAGVIDLSSLESAGTVEISGNTAAGIISLGELGTVAGEITITDNTNASVIDLSSLTDATGNVTIGSNAPNVVVSMSGLTNYGCAGEVTLTLNGGTVEVTNGLTLCTNATLTGSATVDGSVTNNGTIEPGSSPGQLNITGHLHMNNASRLKLEIGGSASNELDFVNVGNTVTLGGTISVSLHGNFKWAMTNGDSFTVVTSGTSLVGSFANVASGAQITTTDGYARFILNISSNTVRLDGLQIVDSDGDGMPDWWEDNFSLSKTNATDAGLDLDGDRTSNAAEFSAGTDPTNPASVFGLLSIEPETNGVRLTWSAVGGKTYRVQTNGTLSGEFTDGVAVVTASGVGEFITNVLSPDAITNVPARYYRLRLGP
jgi:hypothetical protein